MALAYGDLVDADYLGIRLSGTTELFAQVLLFEFLDRFPVKAEFLGNILDRSGFDRLPT
jgi:hypothetical protein